MDSSFPDASRSRNGSQYLTWPWTSPGNGRHTLVRRTIRAKGNLPLYCNPIALFLGIWITMLACLSVHVSYAIYPHFGTPVLVFAVSTISLLLGYSASSTVFDGDVTPRAIFSYVLDVTALWRMNLLLCVLAALIVILNWVTEGPPPALGDPTTYLAYGRFKQILFPVLSTVAVNSTFDSSRLRRFLFLTFSVSILTVYITRGALLTTFLQMFFLFSMRTSISKRNQYLLAISAFVFAVAGVTAFGNLRTAHDVFINFLQIRGEYEDWPMAALWFVSYFSVPLSNLSWMIAHPPAYGPTLAFLYQLLPTFMAPPDPYAQVYASTNIIDNGSTYLQAYALDFSYLGIYFANLILGVGCRWFVTRSYPKYMLVLSIFLTSMSFIFIDMFLVLTTVLQATLQIYVAKRYFAWKDQPSVGWL